LKATINPERRLERYQTSTFELLGVCLSVVCHQTWSILASSRSLCIHHTLFLPRSQHHHTILNNTMRTRTSHSISLLLALLAVAHIDAFQLNTGRIRISRISPSKAFQRFSPNPSSSSKSIVISQTATTSPEDSKCPVTQFGNKVTRNLGRADKYLLSRLIRIANHVPALMSLSYFGLISMASMMSMGPMKAGCDVTLSNVLTRTVGATTNAEFAALFPTLVTPASFVFLVWPLIAVLQLITVSIWQYFPAKKKSYRRVT